MLQSLQRRIGESPERRLQWVIDFARKDLSVLRREERIALGMDLRSLAIFSLPMGRGSRGGLTTAVAPMADRTLTAYQQSIATGLQRLLSRDAEPWELPAHPALALSRVGDGPSRFRVIFTGDEAAGILGGVANLVLEAGERLRACVECGTAFVKRKRQEYCSTRCSMRSRNRTRRPKRRKGGR